MDYSQFLYMHDELSLIAIIVILFLADLFLCADRKSGQPSKLITILPVALLLVQTAGILITACPSTNIEAFGGMYQNNGMMSIVKGVLNIGTIIVFLWDTNGLPVLKTHRNEESSICLPFPPCWVCIL